MHLFCFYNPYIRFLYEQPNPLMSGVVFRQKMATQLILNNNAFALIVRDELGIPKEMYIESESGLMMVLRPKLDKLIKKIREAKELGVDIILCTTAKDFWVERFFNLKPEFRTLFDKKYGRPHLAEPPHRCFRGDEIHPRPRRRIPHRSRLRFRHRFFRRRTSGGIACHPLG